MTEIIEVGELIEIIEVADVIEVLDLDGGVQGLPGTAATIEVGTVTTGTPSSVTNVGTTSAAVLNFVLEKGDQGDPGLKGDQGDPGTDGITWFMGTTDPTTEGVDGDLYLNYTTWHVWEKISGTWTDKGTIKGADGEDGTDGNTILGGTVDPTTEGVDGDWYINRTTWHIWEKATGTWTDRGSIKGADGEDGADGVGIPSITSGDAGKVLAVKSDVSGAEWVDVPSGGTTEGVSLGIVIALS